MKKRHIVTAQVLAAVLLAAASTYMFISKTAQAREKKEYEQLSGTYADVVVQIKQENIPLSGGTIAGEIAAQPDARRRLDVNFDALHQMNSDTKGWIYIDGTPINHPFVQTYDNSSYLSKSFTGERSGLGTIFLDCELTIDDSPVLILYGHNMGINRDEMFSPLNSYDSPEFLRNHNEILTLTPGSRETIWEIFAVLHISTAADVYPLYRKDGFADDRQYNDYIELIKSMQLFDTGITPVPNQRILMLSTCLGDTFGIRRSDMRRIVFAAELTP